jgi:hypothetical protein
VIFSLVLDKTAILDGKKIFEKKKNNNNNYSPIATIRSAFKTIQIFFSQKEIFFP